MSARRSTLRNYAEYAAASLLLAVLRNLPHRWGLRVAGIVISVMRLAVPKLQRIAMRNLALAFPALPEVERIALRIECFHTMARVLHAFACLPGLHPGNIHKWIRYEGFEHFEAAKRQGKGVLFATGHVGTWELSASAHALLTEPMHVVVRPLDNPLLDALTTRYRSASGNTIHGKTEAARGILKAMQHNEAVGILADQNGLLDHGMFVDFFGVPACTDTRFARLAFRSGAAILPGFAFWSEAEQRHILKFYPPLSLTGDAALDTALIQQAIEKAIREAPGQWLWVHRRWKTRPPGSPALY